MGSNNNNSNDASKKSANAEDAERNLCNVLCRLGAVSLLETVPLRINHGAATADVLIACASIDVADLDRVSKGRARPLSLSFSSFYRRLSL
jgi:hypothetical protein